MSARALEVLADVAEELHALGGDDREAARLGVPEALPPSPPLVAALAALERSGQRLAALDAARAHLASHPDAEIAAFARGVSARLVRGPAVDLVLDGHAERVLFGDRVTLGRSGATLSLPSPLLSRVHLALRRLEGAPAVEDQQSHNGTWLAGARVDAPLPVGAGLQLALARQIPLSLRPAGEGLVLEVAGERARVPLGPLVLRGLVLTREERAGEAVITLRLVPGVAASLGDVVLRAPIELARGDVVRVVAPDPWELRVVG